jgi:hypothetical protein
LSSRQINLKLCALLLALCLPLFSLRTAIATSPLDNSQQDVSIDATLASGDLASSRTSFNPAQYSVIRLDSLWVNCGINNAGPTASIRVYLSLSSDAVVWYFEFRQVYGGWSGVAKGYADYSNGNNNYAMLQPSGANGGTGSAVNTDSPFVYTRGGGFISIVRVWLEGADAQAYAGECQYGIQFENGQSQNSGGQVQPVQPTSGGDYSGYFVALGVLVVAVGGLVYLTANRRRSTGRRIVCSNCGYRSRPEADYCSQCGTSLTDNTRMY